MSPLWKNVVKRTLNRSGIEVRRPGPGRIEVAWKLEGSLGLRRGTLAGAMRNLSEAGFRPTVVIDVGAAYGTAPLYRTFPDSHHLLIEPLAEFEPTLRRIAASLRSAELFLGVAGAARGQVHLNVHTDLVGSSTYREGEDSGVNGRGRLVPAAPLSDLLGDRPGPFLMKIDTQGAELDVLRGAAGDVLTATEVAVLEVSFMQFFEGGPLAAEVIAFMADAGFVPYYILDAKYRPLDSALSQVDMIFVRRDSALRAETAYATMEQRAEQDRKLLKAINR